MLKINTNVGPISLINMESSCEGKKNVTYREETVDLPAGIGPQVKYLLSYIVYCRVSRSLHAALRNPILGWHLRVLYSCQQLKSKSFFNGYTTEQLPAKPLNSTKYRTTQIFNQIFTLIFSLKPTYTSLQYFFFHNEWNILSWLDDKNVGITILKRGIVS